MKDKKDNSQKRFLDFQEEQEYALDNYGVRVKNRAGKKKCIKKFTEKNERDFYAD